VCVWMKTVVVCGGRMGMWFVAAAGCVWMVGGGGGGVCGVMGTKGEWGVALSPVENVEPEADERRFHKEIINNQRCPSLVACG
jgi:hypothetical protein